MVPPSDPVPGIPARVVLVGAMQSFLREQDGHGGGEIGHP
jgi:hypothetical protein